MRVLGADALAQSPPRLYPVDALIVLGEDVDDQWSEGGAPTIDGFPPVWMDPIETFPAMAKRVVRGFVHDVGIVCDPMLAVTI